MLESLSRAEETSPPPFKAWRVSLFILITASNLQLIQELFLQNRPLFHMV